MGVTAAPRTFGILSIVFASLVLVGSLFGLLGLLVPMLAAHAPPPTRPEDAQALKMLSTMYLGMGLISAILSVMSALLIALGIGQLRYRKWAAVWSVRWAIVALGAVVVMAILMTTTMRSTVGSIASRRPGSQCGGGASGRHRVRRRLRGHDRAVLLALPHLAARVLLARPRARGHDRLI